MIAKLARCLLLAAVKQEIARVDQVTCHKARRQHGVTLLDCDHDRPMELKGVLDLDELRGNVDHVEHSAMDGVEEAFREAVPGCLKDSAMEEKIGRNEANVVAAAAFEVDDGLFKQRDILHIGPFGGLGCDRGLNH